MSLPVRVAVFGSCVTRDVFNRRFSPNYRDLFDCVLLANQSSVISLMSPPVDATAADLTGIDDAAQREARADLSRSFLPELVRLQPEYLIVDFFADVHFGCAVLDGGIVTRNRWKIVKTPFYQATWKEDLPPRGRASFDLWKDAAARFVADVRAQSPNTRIVLHAAKNATSYRTTANEVVPLAAADRLQRMNQRWDRLNRAFAPLADATIDVFTDETISFEEHPWGKFPVHYELDYHAAFLSRLSALALDDARTTARQAQAARSLRSRLSRVPFRRRRRADAPA
jgi:Family of unknown function (DUF6270)